MQITDLFSFDEPRIVEIVAGGARIKLPSFGSLTLGESLAYAELLKRLEEEYGGLNNVSDLEFIPHVVALLLQTRGELESPPTPEDLSKIPVAMLTALFDFWKAEAAAGRGESTEGKQEIPPTGNQSGGNFNATIPKNQGSE